MPRRKNDKPKAAHRPLIDINWDLVDGMLRAQSNGVEIAGTLGMHPHTFYDRVAIEKGISFTDYASKLKAAGLGLFRLKQYNSAMKGNSNLLIHLGKELLGQGQKKIDDSPDETRSEIAAQVETLDSKNGSTKPTVETE